MFVSNIPLEEFFRGLEREGKKMKRCSKCQQEKEITEFGVDRQKKDSLNSMCRDCYKEYRRQWRKDNPSWGKDYVKKWRKENPLRAKEINEKWFNNNHDKLLESNRQSNNKRRSTAKGKICHSMSSLMRHSLKKGIKNRSRWEDLAGYTWEELRHHLETRFLPGMTWENMGEWHIDHIIPVSHFYFDNPEDQDFKVCWSLLNLRPLWAKDNLSKGNKVLGEV